MPIDPGIPLSVRPPTTFNIPDIQLRNLAMQREQRLNRQMDMEEQARQQELADRQQERAEKQRQQQEAQQATAQLDEMMKRIFQSGRPTSETVAKELAESGQFHLYSVLAPHLKAFDEQKAELDKTQERKDKAAAQMAAGVAKLGNTPAAFDMAVRFLKLGAGFTDEELAPYVQAAQEDPSNIEKITTLLAGPLLKEQATGKTREVRAWNPEKQQEEIQIVEDKPGQAFPVAPKTVTGEAKLGQSEDFMLRFAREKGKTPDQLTTQEVSEGLRRFNALNDQPRAASGGPGGAGGLTPDAIDYTATAYRVLGTRAIPTRIEGPERVRILNKAAEQAKFLGQSPAQAVQKQAAFKADQASLTKMGTMKSAAQAFENKAIGQADIVKSLSDKVGRTQFPLINSAIMAGKTEVLGDKDATLLTNAITTFTSEYAKIMEGATGSAAGSTDSARAAAARLISAKMNKGTLADTLELMKREMKLTIDGYDAVIGDISERMGAAPTAPAAATGAGGVTGKVGKYTYTVK